MMALPIFKTRQAERDIEECFVYIAEENLDSGVYFLVAVEESIEMLTKNPYAGSPGKFNSPKLKDVRMWRVKSYPNYLIFYLPKDESIEVLRVVNSKRDYRLLFDDE